MQITNKIFFIAINTGGPTKCGFEDLTSNFTINTNEEISVNITLCGKPQPIVLWMLGDKSINGTVDSTKADQLQYRYSFNQRITSDMCGKYLSYQATGFQNISGSYLVLLKNCKSKWGFLIFSTLITFPTSGRKPLLNLITV